MRRIDNRVALAKRVCLLRIFWAALAERIVGVLRFCVSCDPSLSFSFVREASGGPHRGAELAQNDAVIPVMLNNDLIACWHHPSQMASITRDTSPWETNFRASLSESTGTKPHYSSRASSIEAFGYQAITEAPGAAAREATTVTAHESALCPDRSSHRLLHATECHAYKRRRTLEALDLPFSSSCWLMRALRPCCSVPCAGDAQCQASAHASRRGSLPAY